MASPQKENGYTALANELVDAFAKINLSSYEWRIVFGIIRHSYGWNKKEAILTYSQIESFCKIKKCHISRTINSLLRKQIITKEGKKYTLQKDYEKWGVPLQEVPLQEVPLQVIKGSSTGNKRVPLQELKTGKKRNNINNLQGAKDIYKDIYKDISLRERLLKLWITHFPNLTFPETLAKKVDYFFYQLEQNKITSIDKIKNIKAYIKSLDVEESFPNIVEREAEREKLERQQLEKLKREKIERQKMKTVEMKKLISEFRNQLERKDAICA